MNDNSLNLPVHHIIFNFLHYLHVHFHLITLVGFLQEYVIQVNDPYFCYIYQFKVNDTQIVIDNDKVVS